MRDAKLTQIFEGTNQIQHLAISRHLAKGTRAAAGVAQKRQDTAPPPPPVTIQTAVAARRDATAWRRPVTRRRLHGRLRTPVRETTRKHPRASVTVW
jgi:hypothetical protein